MTKNSDSLEKKIAKMKFEEALERLEEIVETLSQQKVSLDEMIALYQEGDLLKKHCAASLEEAKMKIEIVGQKS